MPNSPEQLISQFSLVSIAPEIVLTLVAMAVLLLGAFFPDQAQRRLLPGVTLLGAVLSGLAVVALWGKNLTFGPAETAIYGADDFALFFKALFLMSLAVTVLISGRFLKARTGDRHTVIGEYYALLLLATVGMMMVASARDLIIVFLGIETLSIALYVLAGFARARLMSNEAALKYFLLGAFATGFLLYGIALTYFATGSTLLPQIAAALANASSGSPLGVNVATNEPINGAYLWPGMALMLIGLGFKTAMVPFHMWTPDVYEGSPTPVTAFMATGAKAAAFAAFMRVFSQALGGDAASAQWHNIVLILAVLTMTVGNLVAIAQDSLKRMLAYSSIAHAGYVLIGILATASAQRAANGQATTDVAHANASVLIYLAIYALMNLGAFAVLVHLEHDRAENNPDWNEEEGNVRVGDVRALAWRKPGAALALTVFLLSLAGIPPTAGFFGKFFIFAGAVNQGLIGLALVGVLNSAISLYFYMRPVVEMWMQDAPELGGVGLAPDGSAAARSGFSLSVTVAIVVCTIAVLSLAGVQGFFNWAQAGNLLPR
jgi:NADH-quinone oxidoreductase subunit N